MEGQPVQLPRLPRAPDEAVPLARCQPGVRSRFGEVLLGAGVVQPEGFLRRRQLVGPKEALEHQEAPLPQFRKTTVGHPHRRQKLTGTYARRTRWRPTWSPTLPRRK